MKILPQNPARRPHISIVSDCRGLIAAMAWMAPVVHASTPGLSPEKLEFFESKIRPVLATECYECHGAEKQKGGLRLDYKAGWEKGGDSGPSILPGNPKDSLLLHSVRHEDPDLKMPSKAPKLSPEAIAHLEKWVAMGAPDPREKPEPISGSTWSLKLAERRKWWSFQPVQNPAPPVPQNASWSSHPVDQFLLHAMEKKGLSPAAEVSPGILLRRLRFVLTGLTPSPTELLEFQRTVDRLGLEKAAEQETDRLMALPAFGERWARHWMDLVRYAESHGSEGDPALPEAWRYRDYLIRAWNADVPMDLLLREHLAGDLLPNPRIHSSPTTRAAWNESAIGTAHFRMMEHGYQPVDTLDEQIKVVDNQIDVISKAFQGLTISCARCHDHKFDAISQKDYYAVFGILASTRPLQRSISPTPLPAQNTLQEARSELRTLLARTWEKEIDALPENLAKIPPDSLPIKDPAHPFHAWATLQSAENFKVAWEKFAQSQTREIAELKQFNAANFHAAWTLAGPDYQRWFRHGNALGTAPAESGESLLLPGKEPLVKGLLPAGAFSGAFTAKAHATFASPRFKVTTNRISVRAAGGSKAQVRLIVDNYPLGNPTTLFPQTVLNRDATGWITLNVDYRKGSWAYLEFTTGGDAPRTPSKPEKNPVEPDSWFAVSEVVFHDSPNPPRPERSVTEILLSTAPETAISLADRYQKLLRESVAAWRAHSLSEPQRALLDASLRLALLSSNPAQIAGAAPVLQRIESAENGLENPVRISGIADGEGIDWPLLNRGDHLQPGDPVPRGYLEVLGKHAFLAAAPDATARSGRLELAEALTSPQNPLTTRVLANRIWHHVFGRGLVPSVDNFGRLGEPCSNPDLLDHLASRFASDSWSAKKLIRFLVTSRTFRLSSVPSQASLEHDPSNDLLSHANLRRIDAETLRDTLLQLSDTLDPTMEGPSAPPVDAVKPLGRKDAYRRSVYLQSRRSVFNGLLDVFDSPKPFTTVGRRDVTNVPAQALALLNDPWVASLAHRWAQAVIEKDPEAGPESRVRSLFLSSLCRPPTEAEMSGSLRFLDQLRSDNPNPSQAQAAVWARLAHSLLNLKEFLYIP